MREMRRTRQQSLRPAQLEIVFVYFSKEYGMPPSNAILRRSDRWKSAYESAISETQDSVCLTRIADARNAIFDRTEEILSRSARGERRELNLALRTLRSVEEAAVRKRTAA